MDRNILMHTHIHLLSLNSLVDSLALKAQESKSPGNSTKAKTISLLSSKKALVKNDNLGQLVVKLLILARFELGVFFNTRIGGRMSRLTGYRVSMLGS